MAPLKLQMRTISCGVAGGEGASDGGVAGDDGIREESETEPEVVEPEGETESRGMGAREMDALHTLLVELTV
jgi:hypothetical protein